MGDTTIKTEELPVDTAIKAEELPTACGNNADVIAELKQGYAVIKPEYIRPFPKEDVDNAEKNNDAEAEVDNNVETKQGWKPPKRRFGMDRKREKKMAQARAEVRHNTARLCPSILIPGRECRFGDKCNAGHSIEEYMKVKPEDLGDKCIIYDLQGKCNFSLACRFAKAHTGENYEQLTKSPDANYQETLNANAVPLQKVMRKKEYDFSLSEEICKTLAAIKKDDPPLGAMEREKLKLDMGSLKGKKYLAPLTTVGNLPFRRLCVDYGADVTCGEMAMATNLLQGLPGEWSLVKRHPSEKIFGVQLAGGFPDSMSRAAQILTENMEVDFIDINLGCPLDGVNDKGGGCALASRSRRLMEVMRSMHHVMGETPLTIKMRYGVKDNDRSAHHVIRRVVENCPPQLITLHPRSKDQRYTKAAEWDYVPECVQAAQQKVPLWACGDVCSYAEYYDRLENTGVDGVMIGRAALIKPWIFTEIDERRHWDISASERLDLIRRFANYGLEHWGSDEPGVECTRRFMLEWFSFQHRYIPVGLLERVPVKLNEKPPPFVGRSDLETLLSSRASSDWIKVSEMFLGKVPDGFLFVPKHRANAY